MMITFGSKKKIDSRSILSVLGVYFFKTLARDIFLKELHYVSDDYDLKLINFVMKFINFHIEIKHNLS